MGSDLNFAADRQMADAGGCGTSECNAPGYLVQANGLCTDCNLDAASDSMGSASSGSGSATSSSSSSYSHSSVDSCDRSDGRAPTLAHSVDPDSFAHGTATEEYVRMVAARLHHEWRLTRLQEDGTFLPRPKKIDGQEFDIANLDYDDLPEAYKFENREAARVACESVREQIGESSNIRASHAVLDDEFVTRAAIAQHDAWVERNSGRADPSLCIPYEDLPEHEKEKDRLIVREAIRLYRLWCIRSPSRVSPHTWPGFVAATAVSSS